MTFPEAVRAGFLGYADFRGKATRSEFWWFYAFVVILEAVAAVLDPILGLTWRRQFGHDLTVSAGGLVAAVRLLTILPLSAVFFRRIHDLGRHARGLYALIVLYPPVCLLVAVATKSAVPLAGARTGVLFALALGGLALLAYVLLLLCRKGVPQPETASTDRT